jgi:predicted unusual protein kinase regulating ubiquinone biosynthesis (AarF/ABC1/UbiB family)
VIKKIVEEDMGKKMEDVFSSFDEVPIGSASIGQVHFAKLKAGDKKVVVKVQYPEAERYFALDFWTALKILEFVNPGLIEVMKKNQETFMSEFDYKREAKNLELMNSHVSPHFPSVQFPKPLNEHLGKRVLVMTQCEGATITKYGKKLLAEIAKTRGKTPEEFKTELRNAMRDPKKLETLSKVVPSLNETFFDVLRSALHLKNVILFWLPATYIPPNGPRLMQILFDVHGREIFNLGAFNSDPHAGNIMLDEKTGIVSLLDYGQLVTVEDEVWRENFARYIVALADEDKDEVVRRWKDLGNEFVWKPTGEINPPDITYACACFHFGGPPGIKKALSMLGIRMSKLHSDVFTKIDITKSTSQYAMLQRTCFCLIGVAQQVGAGAGVIPSQMLRSSAVQYIEECEAKRKDAKEYSEKRDIDVAEKTSLLPKLALLAFFVVARIL